MNFSTGLWQRKVHIDPHHLKHDIHGLKGREIVIMGYPSTPELLRV
jgi:hypothetical protein